MVRQIQRRTFGLRTLAITPLTLQQEGLRQRAFGVVKGAANRKENFNTCIINLHAMRLVRQRTLAEKGVPRQHFARVHFFMRSSVRIASEKLRAQQ